MMFLDCPAYLDQAGAVRCGLPAEVRCRFTMDSTDGLVESAMIQCPAGHYFCGAIESLTWNGMDKHDPGSHDVRDGAAGSAAWHFPPSRSRVVSRPNTAPAYYLGHPARLWLTVTRPRRRHTRSHDVMQTSTGGRIQTPSRQGRPVTGARAETACTTPATRSWPVTRVQ